MLPSVLVVAPSAVAVCLLMRRYYFKNPVRRITDPHFLGSCVAILFALVFVCMTGFHIGDLVLGYVCLVVDWGVMIAAIVFTLRGLPETDHSDARFRS